MVRSKSRKIIVFVLFVLLISILAILSACTDAGQSSQQGQPPQQEQPSQQGQSERGRYKVLFLADQNSEYGSIYYLENHGDSIYYGECSSKVRAIPRSGCVFLYWSDGSTEVERQISFVTEDITLTAYFGYSADYTVNDNVGGKIVGKINQAVLPGSDFEAITAVADEGYVFAGWSDLKMQSSRQDLSAERCCEYIAYFEPIEKSFRYDYVEAVGIPLVNEVTINRSELANVEFVIPKLSGFAFCGWYADKDYSLMVANESGIYMLGVYGLSLETDTLYAKWKIQDADDGIIHKVLVVIVQDIEATLYSKKADKYIEVDYSMTSLEREFCSLIPKKMSYYLNDWFKEKDIHFEVDSYYTLQTVHVDSNGAGNYSIFADELPEMGALNLLYHNVIVVHGMNDYDGLLHSVTGLAGRKYGDVYLDSLLLPYIINHEPLQNVLNGWLNDDPGFLVSVSSALHEFVHTCENNYNYTEIMEFHAFRADYMSSGHTELEAERVYLLGIAELNGQTGGVPNEYFMHENEIHVNYVDTTIDGRSVGRIVVVGEAPPEESWITYVSRQIPYGSSITVEAAPKDGYRFLKWSDGVTTAIRTDTVISYVNVKAIFVADS